MYTIFAPDKDKFMKDMSEAYDRGAIRTWVTTTNTRAPNIITITIKKEESKDGILP